MSASVQSGHFNVSDGRSNATNNSGLLPENDYEPRHGRWKILSSPGRQVTKNVTTKADEDNAVPGWIAAAPLDFSVGH